jgi:four helix bundle protein
MADFKKLDVFHKAHALALATVKVSAGMRGYVGTGIKSQMVRAALSVPTNIVEGSA